MNKYGVTFYLFGIVIFFMLMDIFFISVAYNTFSGIYTENYYQKGLDFDKIHKQEIYDKNLGWQIKVVFNKDFNKITVKAFDNKAAPLLNAKVYAKLISPVTDKYDQSFFLKENVDGEYSTNFQPKSKGQFYVRVKILHSGKEFITTEKVVFKGGD